MKKKLLMSLIIVSLITIAASGCLSDSNQNKISVKGSTTVLPVASSCADQFNKQNEDIKVLVSGGGSSVGIKSVATGSADIGMASREVKQEEIEKYGEKFNDHVIAYDGIAVIVSKNIYQSGVEGLSIEDVRKIYTGEVNNWQEFGGPDKEIFVVTREAGSGTRAVFYETIGIDEEAVDMAGSGNARVKQAVSNSEKAIGFLGLGYAGGEVEALKINGVEPTAQTVKSGEYPIKRSLHMYTWEETSEGEQEFLNFVLSEDGQQIVEEIGYIPAN